ncbi:YceI-like domain-containing protein [Nonlabens dokdonensis]|uniref:YceI domain containing protein n=2 Tax=Nonlabens dokdonensis TaxID=328515 RepID=L7WHE3_NONDD|nr:YceI family protein [Nonlabens dokdonensis]AGC78393.1 YceI domain containing protein [Nonlabens dokdonensis DSW-6]PZX38143.1 YceI-like domain-containing protein [Nonlabens dokdonensis]
MKTILFSILSLLLISNSSSDNITERFQTRTGTVAFKASVGTFEPIEAVNKSTTIVLDVNSGNIAALALVNGFRFPVALMQEHFNENYLESDEFPKAVIKGKLSGFKATAITQNFSKTYILDGTLKLHGVTQIISIPVNVNRTGKSIIISSNFIIRPQDYNIVIPKIVSDKIADEVLVNVNAELFKDY